MFLLVGKSYDLTEFLFLYRRDQVLLVYWRSLFGRLLLEKEDISMPGEQIIVQYFLYLIGR